MLEYRIIHRDNGDTVTDVSIVEQEVRTLIDQDTGEEVQHRGQKMRRAFAAGDHLPPGVTVRTATAEQMTAAKDAMVLSARTWIEDRLGHTLADLDTLASIQAAQDLADAEREAQQAIQTEMEQERADAQKLIDAEREAKEAAQIEMEREREAKEAAQAERDQERAAKETARAERDQERAAKAAIQAELEQERVAEIEDKKPAQGGPT